MRILEVIFYHYYSFFKKRMPFDISPEFSIVIGMSAILCFAVMGVIGVPLAFVSRFGIDGNHISCWDRLFCLIIQTFHFVK